jgi:hypothetical protein
MALPKKIHKEILPGLLFRNERKSDQSGRGKSDRWIHDEYLDKGHGSGQRRLARSEEGRRIRLNCGEDRTPDPKVGGSNPLRHATQFPQPPEKIIPNDQLSSGRINVSIVND